MTIPRVCAAVTVLAVLSFAPIARAGWLNESMRVMGIGCSDGYHSRSNCPPRTWRIPQLPFGEREVLIEETPAPAAAKSPLPLAPPATRSSSEIAPPSQAARPSPPPSTWR